MHLILPKSNPDLRAYNHLPLFFLAGPINGGDDWHRSASYLVRDLIGPCIIVNPSRYTAEHPLYRYRLQGNEDFFPRQTHWERYFLQQAAWGWPSGGAIIFWLAKESARCPRNDGEPYARDTMGEVGEWRGHLAHNPRFRVAMGADPEFHGLSVITANFNVAVPHLQIHSTVTNTILAARDLTKPRVS